jgi:hypothetical protein
VTWKTSWLQDPKFTQIYPKTLKRKIENAKEQQEPQKISKKRKYGWNATLHHSKLFLNSL